MSKFPFVQHWAYAMRPPLADHTGPSCEAGSFVSRCTFLPFGNTVYRSYSLPPRSLEKTIRPFFPGKTADAGIAVAAITPPARASNVQTESRRARGGFGKLISEHPTLPRASSFVNVHGTPPFVPAEALPF
jgi:hypothetical protein